MSHTPEETRALAPREAPRVTMATVGGGSGSIVELLHEAVRQGTPVEQLEKLVDLHERMEVRQARQAYFDALAAFQAEVPQIKKSKSAKIATGSGGGYQFTYAPLDEIDRTIAPHLQKHGLARRWDTDAAAKAGAIIVTCTITHALGHSESSSVTLPIESKGGMSDQQKVSAAMQFGQRLSLSAALGLVTSDTPADDRDIDPTPVDEAQLTTLEDMIEATGANKARFLAYFGVQSLAQIPAARFEQAIAALKTAAEKREGRR